MLASQVPFYAKFTFNCRETKECYSTADKEYLNFFKYKTTGEPMYGIRVGDEITIHTDQGIDKNYIITSVEVRDLFDNLDLMNYGAHSEDCEEMSGKGKRCLFSIFVTMDLLK